MKELTTYLRTKVGLKILLFFIFLIFLQIVISYLFIQKISYSQVREGLASLSARVKHDLKYQNGKWDTSLYNSDPFTPYPHGSSGFENPLYIVTVDGFIIERNRPISGLLDSSDIKQLVTLQTPQTINAITNEDWRVMSSPIIRNGRTEGVILVGYFNPSHEILPETDDKLKANIELIRSKLQFKNGDLDVSAIDVRNIHYDVSFEVVNRFNKVLTNNGRIPTFIDTSYVAQMLKNPHEQVIHDASTREPFLVLTEVLYDANSNPVGVIVLGKSIESIHDFLRIFIFYSTLTNLLITLPLSILTVYILRNELGVFFEKKVVPLVRKSLPKHVSFNKKDSYLMIDNEKIEIPYASNQYYFCEALLLHPKKRWEQDELLERFGEENTGENWRKVYDAMLAINKKAGVKLFTYQDKTYRVNPDILPALS